MVENKQEECRKKDKFHKLGLGGYAVAMPNWDKSEKEMENAGVTPFTRSWPPRYKSWFYAHGEVGPEDRLGFEEGKS